MPRFPKFRRTPGSSFRERWKRIAISNVGGASEVKREQAEEQSDWCPTSGSGYYKAGDVVPAASNLVRISVSNAAQSTTIRGGTEAGRGRNRRRTRTGAASLPAAICAVAWEMMTASRHMANPELNRCQFTTSARGSLSELRVFWISSTVREQLLGRRHTFEEDLGIRRFYPTSVSVLNASGRGGAR
jgi:hypothetical protein